MWVPSFPLRGWLGWRLRLWVYRAMQRCWRSKPILIVGIITDGDIRFARKYDDYVFTDKESVDA